MCSCMIACFILPTVKVYSSHEHLGIWKKSGLHALGLGSFIGRQCILEGNGTLLRLIDRLSVYIAFYLSSSCTLLFVFLDRV